MPKTTRFVLLLGALILLLPLLAACGGGDEAEPTNAPLTESSDTTPDVTPTREPAAPSESTPSASPATDESTPATQTGESTPTTGEASTPAAPDTVEATATSAPVDPAAPASPPAAEQPRSGGFAYGWNVALRGDDGGQEHNLNTSYAVQGTGFGWVRFQLEWQQFERNPDQWDPLPMDRVIQDLANSGLKILITVAKAPEWALDPAGEQFLSDYADFQNFMQFVADRYHGQVHAWEIWNEQNLAHEVNGTVRAADYVELLKAGFNGIRAVDQESLVVFGGLTPNGVNDPSIAIDDVQYLNEVYAFNNGEVKDYFDIMGAHVSATQTTPDNTWPDDPGAEGWSDHPSFFFRRAEELRQVMIDHGDADKSMWLTEFGWTTENQAPGYEYGTFNSEEDVAQYLTRSFEIMLNEWDWVSGAFVWNLNWSTLAPPEDEKFPWSAVNAEWTPRPAYDAMRALPKN
ncbi:hypothetical protein BH23CHL1_BH23CHL1_06930 [soil metagenome]